MRDSFSHPVPGASVTFTAPASGASCTFSGSATVTTDANGVATTPACTANSTAGSYTVTATATGVGTPANFLLTNMISPPEGLDFYNVTNGVFAFSRNPTLSGGPYSGQTAAQLFATTGIGVEVRDSAGELVIFDATGWHDYNMTTSASVNNYNPTLSGGPYGGQTVGSVFASGVRMDARDASGHLVIFDTTGWHEYNVTTGALVNNYNPTLSGGPFAGQTISSLITNGVRVEIKDNPGQLIIFNANGWHDYYIPSGAFGASYNPTLNGGREAGLTVGQAFTAGLLVSARDSAGSYVALLRGPAVRGALPQQRARRRPPRWALRSGRHFKH